MSVIIIAEFPPYMYRVPGGAPYEYQAKTWAARILFPPTPQKWIAGTE